MGLYGGHSEKLKEGIPRKDVSVVSSREVEELACSVFLLFADKENLRKL